LGSKLTPKTGLEGTVGATVGGGAVGGGDVGGMGVSVGGTAVSVGRGVLVGIGTGVSVGGMGVVVGTAVLVGGGGNGVFVGRMVSGVQVGGIWAADSVVAVAGGTVSANAARVGNGASDWQAASKNKKTNNNTSMTRCDSKRLKTNKLSSSKIQIHLARLYARPMQSATSAAAVWPVFGQRP
jgi:hypothetical protein